MAKPGPPPASGCGELQLRGASRVFEAAVPVVALRPTDLTIRAGQSVAITGRSGSGKSTLLNLLGLLDRPSTGDYTVGGIETGGLSAKSTARLRARHFGFVFQHFHLLNERTALENVELSLMYHGSSRRDRRTLACDALEQVGLTPRRDAYPATLSGGECQRVAIARAVAPRPSVLLCDEPTGNLDRTTAEAILTQLLELNSGGYTLVVVTHDPGVAALMVRTLEVSDGEVSE